MRLAPSCLFLLLFLSILPAHAARLASVEIRGLDEAMTENVRVSLSLTDAVGNEVSGRRLAYLLREAEAETREALEPFGYYSPTIVVSDDRPARDAPAAPADVPAAGAASAAPSTSRAPVAVTITVERGVPVRVRNADIAILGEGGRDRYLREELEDFVPLPGAVFDHASYEASKSRISRRLAERGYFDADFDARRVAVTRAESAADIDLVWSSGVRYDMGVVTFSQEPKPIVQDSLLEKLVYWEEGQYYHQGRLDRLRKSLVALDYFSRVDIEPRPEDAVGQRVPVQVTLTPAKRSIYTSGLSYGTDSGAGVRLGAERRYVNMRGHKALARLDYAQNRKTLTLQYRIPAFAWLDGWYTASLQAADEQDDYIDARRVEFVASRSGQYSRQLNLVASLHTLRERWAYDYEEDSDPTTPVAYRYGTFSFPSLRAEYADVDDPFYARRGIGGTLLLRGGVEGVGSDATFAQVHARANWFKGLGERSRLIVRGELGHTFTDTLVELPPSLRFHAGGDRSIRGYAYREVGPRIVDANGDNAFAVGARNVVTASIEYEQYLASGWGFATFVDSGSAFDDTPDWRTGVGVGLRWKSPVGPLRVDIARGLDDPDSSFSLHLNLGADL